MSSISLASLMIPRPPGRESCPPGAQDPALLGRSGLYRDKRQGVEQADDHGGHPSGRLADLVKGELTIFPYDGSDSMSRTRPKPSR